MEIQVMKNLNIVTMVLLIVGGVNWGLYGFMNTDLVASLLGHWTMASKAVYGLVGLSGLYQLFELVTALTSQDN
jgi:uncharacterized membrane protein YuzA (DUF378 family)